MPSSRSRSQSGWHLWVLKEIVSSPGEPPFLSTSVGTPNTRCACWLKQMQGVMHYQFSPKMVYNYILCQSLRMIGMFANHWEWLACYKVINFPTYFSSLKPYQSVTNIFEYSNIRIYWSQIYIRTFICINFSFANIFGHSFVSNLFVRIYSDIRWWVC